MIRIIDNKKVDITDHEYKLYEQICRSYDRPNFKGEELFKSHFETNEHGIIIFVKPPPDRYTSLEVYCFLISIMHNQHLRNMHEQVNSLVKETEKKINEILEKQNK